MKLVYLSSADIPSRQANGVHVMKMCAAFTANGHEVTLLVPRNRDPLWKAEREVFEFYGVPKTFTIVRLWRPRWRFGDYVYALLTFIATIRIAPDVVYSRFFLGSLLGSFAGIPGGLELHQLLPEGSRLQKRLFRFYISRPAFRRFVVITRPLKKLFIERYGLARDQVLIAPDGADLPSRDATPWGAPSERLQVGYVGHLYHGRGVELILDLAQACEWADFHIVGGTESDIVRVRGEASGAPNVTVHGFVAPSKAEEIRLGMDVLLAPYQTVVGLGSGEVTTERWMSPLKMFEYMAAGKAIVCSDIPILRAVMHDGRNCILCVPDGLSRWVAALTELRDDTARRLTLGRTALEDVKAKYLWKIRAEHILDAIVSGGRE